MENMESLLTGYEIWSLCTSTEYLVHFIPYQVAESTPLSHQNAYGLGAFVVLEMVSVLPQGPLCDLFFDQFFTSLPLLDELTQLGHFNTDTTKVNRLENCPLGLKD